MTHPQPSAASTRCRHPARRPSLGDVLQVIAITGMGDHHRLDQLIAITGIRIGAEQGLRIEPAQRVADKHSADRNDGHPAMSPDGSVGADLDVALAASIPARHRDALPGRGRIGQPGCQVRQALAFCAGPTVRAGL